MFTRNDPIERAVDELSASLINANNTAHCIAADYDSAEGAANDLTAIASHKTAQGVGIPGGRYLTDDM